MALLQVDVDGLNFLAARCLMLAGEICAANPASSSVPSGQATAAAVQAVHASTEAANAEMTARLETTSSKLDRAANAFAIQEATSAGNLAAVAAV
jgi:hypothetical protein